MRDAEALAEFLRGAIQSERVLTAIASIPRERFVREADRGHAYDNTALPIACGQTISQPLVVARMLELLDVQQDERVLDVGTGSGYHAALLARLADRVWTIERHPELSAEAQRAIESLGIENIDFLVGDGSAGVPEFAPFDAINVAAATGEGIPAPLTEQLADGGRMVAPVGVESQRLALFRNVGGPLVYSYHEPVRFVPLIPD